MSRCVYLTFLLLAAVFSFSLPAFAQVRTFYVSPSGLDTNAGTEAAPWKTIQKAFTSATPGSTVLVRSGIYSEKPTVNVSGTATAGYITFQNYPNEQPVIDGTGRSGANIVTIRNRNYIKLIGFEIRNNLNVNFGAGIWVEGGCDRIELRSNKIHEMRGTEAIGIGVYGTSSTKSISNLLIYGNEVYDSDPAESEALTLNGNVELFQVINNYVHDVNNIGIDFIGGEKTCPLASKDAARNGVCRGNIVRRARSNYGGGYAGGIYVDGGRDITIEQNTVSESDIGIEIGAENRGLVTSGVIVRNNLIYNNDKIGLAFGGYDSTRGRVRNCKFLNNTLYNNNSLAGAGLTDVSRCEIFIQYADTNTVMNNIIYGSSNNRLLLGASVRNSSTQNNTINYNLWFVSGGSTQARFYWNGRFLTGFTAYRAATTQDKNSISVDPLFVNPALASLNLHLLSTSPAINAGIARTEVTTDFDNIPRPQGGKYDIGAFEFFTALKPESASDEITPELIPQDSLENSDTDR